jgi:hypothetical protein
VFLKYPPNTGKNTVGAAEGSQPARESERERERGREREREREREGEREREMALLFSFARELRR